MLCDNLEFASHCSEFIDGIFVTLHKGRTLHKLSIDIMMILEDEWTLELILLFHIMLRNWNWACTHTRKIICSTTISCQTSFSCVNPTLIWSYNVVSGLSDCWVGLNALLDFTKGCPRPGKLTLSWCNVSSLLNVVFRNPILVELNITVCS